MSIHALSHAQRRPQAHSSRDVASTQLAREPVTSWPRAADRMVELLLDAGVKLIFGLPGGPIAPLNDALLSAPQIRCITTAHENAAMFAAAGYARVSGKLGVVLVTSGPGIENAMTGLVSAFCENLPLLVLVGEVPRRLHGKNALQDGDRLGIRSALTPITRWTAEVPDAHAAVPMMARAMEIAMTSPRGPVALTLPVDILSSPTPAAQVVTADRCAQPLPHAALEPVIEMVQNTDRGVIFAGSGCRQDSGPYHLRALAECLHWPVMTTPKAKGVFPEGHPLSLGVFGLGGHPSARTYLESGFDTMLAIGTSLGEVATDGFCQLLQPPGARLLHVDVDVAQIGRNYPTDIAIGAPADLFMRQLYRSLPLRQLPGIVPCYGPTTYEDPECAGNGPEGRISPVRAIWEIQQCSPHDTIFAIDSGEHFLFATHYLQISEPDAFLAMTGLGSMGASISALGAKLAAPGRSVAVICGDGGFRMMAGDITTAAAMSAPVVFFVFNDMRLGMVETGNLRIFGRTPDYPVGPMDIPALARAVGARACVVERAGDLLALDLPALSVDRPVVVDIRIDRQVRMPANRRFDILGESAGPTRSRP